ncbi:MAG: phytanoyl-CoA dioxygenase family protein [Sphingorhabdus sp.]
MTRSDIVHFSVSDPVTDMAAELNKKGVVIVDGFLRRDALDRFNNELTPLLEGQSTVRPFMNEHIAGFFGDRTRHLTGLPAKSDVFAEEVLCHPVYMGVCDNILGPNCGSFQLNLAHIIDRGPGGQRQPLHRDEDIWPRIGDGKTALMLASILALGAFTPELGSTLVVPGSHVWPRDRKAKPDEIVATQMEPGSALIYVGSTLHAGGANSRPLEWRRAMHISYCVGWLRTEENHCLATPIERARSLPINAQALLGFGAHDAIKLGYGYLGSVDLQCPIDLLASGEL